MKALLQVLLFTILCLYTMCRADTLSDDEDICRLFKDGTALRKPGFCNIGVKCQNLKSVDAVTCTGSKSFYDKKKNKCTDSASDTYCKSPCTDKSAKYVKDKKNCHGWYQCNGSKTLANGQCAHNMYFDAKQQLCMYPEQTSCKASFDICKDIVTTNIPYKDEDNCHKYFKCTSSLTKGTKREIFTCATGMYFDAKTGSCLAKAQVDCYKHPYPENVCGTTKIPYRSRFVSDGATCRGYFYCKDPGENSRTPDKAPAWGQCPIGEFFEPQTETCQARSHVKCDEDRCDGTGTNGRTLSSKHGCQHYFLCENNATMHEIYCGDGLYFDDVLLQCTSDRKNYPACS